MSRFVLALTFGSLFGASALAGTIPCDEVSLNGTFAVLSRSTASTSVGFTSLKIVYKMTETTSDPTRADLSVEEETAKGKDVQDLPKDPEKWFVKKITAAGTDQCILQFHNRMGDIDSNYFVMSVEKGEIYLAPTVDTDALERPSNSTTMLKRQNI